MNQTDVLPGVRIKLTQRIESREDAWDTEVIGTVLSTEPMPTGAWFAHGKDDKLWLLRIEIQKDDGEISRLTLDRNTRIEVLDS